jgi:hypothetical protein
LVSSEIEFRDASTLHPEKRACNSKWAGLDDQHLVLRNQFQDRLRMAVEQRASGAERANRIERNLAVWSEATKEKDPVVGSTGSRISSVWTIDQAVCVVACLVTLSA